MSNELNPVSRSRRRAAEDRKAGPEKIRARRAARAADAKQAFAEEIVPTARRGGVTPLGRGYFALRRARRVGQ